MQEKQKRKNTVDNFFPAIEKNTAERKTIRESRSEIMGVIIYSNKCVAIGYETTRDFAGKIKSRIVWRAEVEKNHYETMESVSKGDKKICKIINAILLAIAILTGDLYSILVAICIAVFVTGNVASIIREVHEAHITGISKWNATKNMGKFAYERLQRIPTVEEIRQESMISKQSDIADSIITTIRNIVVIILMIVAKGNVIAAITEIAITIVSISLLKREKLGFFERLVVSKPDKEQLEVMVEAIRYWEEKEKNFHTKKIFK